MRFYFGFSKKIPIKWIVTAILGILAFFGLTKVHALELSDLQVVRPVNLGNNFLQTINCNNSTLYDSSWTFTNSVSIDSDNYFLIFPYSTMTVAASDIDSTTTWNYYLVNFRPGLFELFDSTGNSVLCESKEGYILCPTIKGRTYTFLRFNFRASGFSCSGDITSTFKLTTMVWNFIYRNPVASQNQTIIDNQQQIIDSQNDTNDLLNDDSTSESSSSANSFFNDFEIDDSKGITNIVTAPLRFLQGLLTYNPNQCSNLSFDLNMSDDNISQTKALQLPCGNILWSRVPSAVETTYSIFIWGLMAYRVLIGLLKFFNETLDPESSKEYFLDL